MKQDYNIHNTFFRVFVVFLTAGLLVACGKNESRSDETGRSRSAGIWSPDSAEKGKSDFSGTVKRITKDYDGIADQARIAINNHQYDSAISMLQEGAMNGHLRSQRYLGGCLLMLNRNVEGASWTRKAAEAGDNVAQYNLAQCYNYGIGVTGNADEALFWAKKAEENGVPGVMTMLLLGGRTFAIEL